MSASLARFWAPLRTSPCRRGGPDIIRRHLGTASLLFILQAGATPALSQAWEADWCERSRSDRDQHCEVREFTLQPRDGRLSVDSGPNGGIEVVGWAGAEVRVSARVSTRARDERAASDLAREVEILTRAGEVSAEGPRTRGRDSWSVSLRVQVPMGTELDLRSTNGGIAVSETGAGVEARTTNGGIRLTDVTGPVRARTTNGAIRTRISRPLDAREEMDLRTTNGGIELSLPDGISARIDASTTNGGITTDFPITVQGRIGRRLTGTLGDGGGEIRASTTNGGIRITRN